MKEAKNKQDFQSSLTHHLVSGSGTVILFSLLSAPLGYFLRMMYSRSLSIEMYGLFYSLLAFLALIATLNDLGFGESLGYFVPKFIKQKQYKKAWNAFNYDQAIEVGTALFISAIIFLSADFLAINYFETPIAADVIKVFLIFFIGESISSATEKFFVGLQQEKYFSSTKMVKLLLSLIFSSVFFFTNNGNIIFYAASWSVAHFATGLIYRFILQVKNRELVNDVSWDKNLFVQMLKYAIPTLFASAIVMIGAPLDNLLLILFEDLNQVGIYNVVFPLVAISPIFLSPINSLLFPLVSKLEDEPEKLQHLFSTLLKIVPFIAFYFALFIFLFPESILQTVFGSKWMLIAKTPLQVAVLGYVMLPVSSLMGVFAKGLGLVKERSTLYTISTFLKITITVILVYLFGIMGAILANVVIFTLLSLMLGYYINRKVTLSWPVGFYSKLLGLGLVLSVIVYGTSFVPRGVISIGVLGVLYTFLYLVSGLAFNVLDRKSLLLLQTNIKNIKWIK